MTPNSPTDADVRDALVDRVGEVQVPGGNPISEQLVEDIEIDAGVVTFVVDTARMDGRLTTRVADQLRGAGLATEGIDHVRIEAADAEADETGLGVTGVDSMLAVGSAKGGVGKTAVTIALANALDAAGLDVAVFDANVHAPDAPDLLDAEGPVGSSPSGSPMPVNADGIEVISLELIADDGPVAWRGAMVHDVVTDLLGNATWENRDVLLVDMPPGIGEAVTTLVQKAPLDGALLVSTPTDAGVRSAERTGALFSAYDVPTVGVVPNMVAPADDSVAAPYDGDGTDIDDRIDEDALASVDPIPFDPALRDPAALDTVDPETDAERAVASLAEVVESFVDGIVGSDVPEDAVDLRGLPPAAGQQQAVAEIGAAAGGPVTVLTRSDPTEIVDTVGDSLDRDGRELVRSEIEDLDRDGWLVRLEAASENTVEPAD